MYLWFKNLYQFNIYAKFYSHKNINFDNYLKIFYFAKNRL